MLMTFKYTTSVERQTCVLSYLLCIPPVGLSDICNSTVKTELIFVLFWFWFFFFETFLLPEHGFQKSNSGSPASMSTTLNHLSSPSNRTHNFSGPAGSPSCVLVLKWNHHSSSCSGPLTSNLSPTSLHLFHFLPDKTNISHLPYCNSLQAGLLLLRPNYWESFQLLYARQKPMYF